MKVWKLLTGSGRIWRAALGFAWERDRSRGFGETVVCGVEREVVGCRWVGELEREESVGRGRGDRSRVEQLERGREVPESRGRRSHYQRKLSNEKERKRIIGWRWVWEDHDAIIYMSLYIYGVWTSHCPHPTPHCGGLHFRGRRSTSKKPKQKYL